MCAIKEAFNQKTPNFCFLYLFLKNIYAIYKLSLKLLYSASSNKPSSSSLSAFSVKYSAKCKHCYVCLCAMSGLVQASTSWMQNWQGSAVCLIGAWDVSVYKSWSQAGATTGGVLSASLLHSAFVWVCVRERTTLLHVLQTTKEILNITHTGYIGSLIF